MNKKFIKVLKELKNSLGDDARALADAIQSAISEAENAEETITLTQLTEKLNEVLNQAEESSNVEIENRIDKLKLELKNDFNGAKKRNEYLASKQATKDFLNTVRTARNGDEQRQMWQAKLVENGLSGVEYPVEIAEEVLTKWEENTGLAGRVKKVASKTFKILFTEQDKTSADLRAKGHKRGKNKIPQNLILKPKQLNQQLLYVDLYVDRIDIVNIDNDTALFNWIVEELNFMLNYEVERAILRGDNRLSNSDDKVSTIESVGGKEVTDIFTIVDTADGDLSLLENLKRLIDKLVTNGREIWVYAPKSNITTLQKFNYGAGGAVQFLPVENVAGQLGVAELKPFDLDEGVEAVVLCPDYYYRIGGEPFGEDWTIYEKNQEAFRAEVAIGGGVAKPFSSGVLLASGAEVEGEAPAS